MRCAAVKAGLVECGAVAAEAGLMPRNTAAAAAATIKDLRATRCITLFPRLLLPQPTIMNGPNANRSIPVRDSTRARQPRRVCRFPLELHICARSQNRPARTRQQHGRFQD